MAAHHFLSGEGGLWVQRQGPGTPVAFLGCHQVGDVDQPEGDIEIVWCPDPSGPNRFRPVGSVQGAAGPVTTTITTDVMDEFDELERVKCPMNLYVNYRRGGRADVFMNFDRTFVFVNARITSRGLSNMVARTPDDNGRVEQTYDVSAEKILRLAEPAISRQQISETQNIRDITFCNSENCRTEEEAYQASCQVGYAVANAAPGGSVAATANVLKTTNGGTWTPTATDPFLGAEDISAVDCFEYGRDTVRVIVARGSTAAGPAQIAYTDDSGASWIKVTVGSVNGQFVPSAHALEALDIYNIWVATDDGYIYKSEDAGLTWTAQLSGGVTSDPINTVRFIDANVGWAAGDNNIILRTTDGGTTWATVTGPSGQGAADIRVVEVIDRNRAWIGFSDGKLYRTVDAGVTWEQMSFSGSGVGEVTDVRYFDDTLGYMLRNNGTGVGRALWTIDGGKTWAELVLNTNTGYNAMHICDEWSFFIAGDIESSTGYIAKAQI